VRVTIDPCLIFSFNANPKSSKKIARKGGANKRSISECVDTVPYYILYDAGQESLLYLPSNSVSRSSAKQQRGRMQRRGNGGVDNRVVLLLAAALLLGYSWTTTCCQAFLPSSSTTPSSQPRRSTKIFSQEGGGRSSSRSEQIFRLNSSSSSNNNSSKNRPRHQISIEYSTGCRWNLRAFWMAQELLTTFCSNGAAANNKLEAVTLIPCSADKSGRFVVKCYDTTTSGTQDDQKNENPVAPPATVLWDRTEMKQGFPELKRLKQLVRDVIDPDRSLGHSDNNNSVSNKDDQTQSQQSPQSSTASSSSERATTNNNCEPAPEDPVFRMPTIAAAAAMTNSNSHPHHHHVAIAYCTGCRWMLRAAYLAQELVQTFDGEIAAMSLVPCSTPAGTFVVTCNDDVTLWDRRAQKRFPETKELKQLVRDQLNPSKDLGHSDNNKDHPKQSLANDGEEEMDEDEAESARRFFGVL